MKCNICGKKSSSDLCDDCHYYDADRPPFKIKFRGKDKINGEWKYGDLVRIQEGEFKIHYIVENGIYYKVYPVSIDQWSTFKDKNSNEIYNNDIIKRNDRIGLVLFFDGAFEIKWKNKKYSSTFTEEIYNESEVIGNEHENKDLFRECWN